MPRTPDPSARSAQHRAAQTPSRQATRPGFGRTQVLKAHETLIHRPSTGAACAEALPADAPSVCDAGFPSVDLVWGDPAQPGLRLRVTDHRFPETPCACGHVTRARSGEGIVADPTLAPRASAFKSSAEHNLGAVVAFRAALRRFLAKLIADPS